MGHLILDFDLTFVKTFTGGALPTKFLTDKNNILKLLAAEKSFKQVAVSTLVDSNFHLSFATKGDKNSARTQLKQKNLDPENYLLAEKLVKFFCLLILPEEVVEKINIQAFMAQNKNPHIEQLIAITGDDDVVLLDDDIENIIAAWVVGYPAIWIDNSNFTTSLEKVLSDYLDGPNIYSLVQKNIISTYNKIDRLETDTPDDSIKQQIQQAKTNILNNHAKTIILTQKTPIGRDHLVCEMVYLKCIAGIQALLNDDECNNFDLKNLFNNRDLSIAVYQKVTLSKSKTNLFITALTQKEGRIVSQLEHDLPTLLADPTNAEKIMFALCPIQNPRHHSGTFITLAKQASDKLLAYVQTHCKDFTTKQPLSAIRIAILANDYPYFSSIKKDISSENIKDLISFCVNHPAINEQIFTDLINALLAFDIQNPDNNSNIFLEELLSKAIATENSPIISILTTQYKIKADENLLFRTLSGTTSPEIAELMLSNIASIQPKHLLAIASKPNMANLCKQVLQKHAFSSNTVDAESGEILLDALLKITQADSSGCYEFILFLLSKTESVTEKTLMLCVEYFHHDLIPLVYSKSNTQPDSKTSLTTLFKHQKNFGRKDTLFELIKIMPLIDLEMPLDSQNNTLAHYAIMQKDHDVLKLLRNWGTYIDMPNKAGETPFILFCQEEDEVCIIEDEDEETNSIDKKINLSISSLTEILFQQPPCFNINHVDEGGHTGLLYSIEMAQPGLCHYLITMGANVQQETKLGNALTYLEEQSDSFESEDDESSASKKEKLEKILTEAKKTMASQPTSEANMTQSALRALSLVANQNNNTTARPSEKLTTLLSNNQFKELQRTLNLNNKLLEEQSSLTRIMLLLIAIEHQNYRAVCLLLDYGTKQDLKDHAFALILVNLARSEDTSNTLAIMELLLTQGAHCHLENSLVYQSILLAREDNQPLKALLDKYKPSVLGKHSRDDMHEDESTKHLKLKQSTMS